MADSILSLFHHRKTCVAMKLFGLILMMLLQKNIGAVEFQVGGSKGWNNPSESFNQWAESHRFQIGDSLVFKYPGGQDSVLLVNQDAYKNCNTESSIKSYSDGHTVVKFEKSGPHYFISGNKDNCLKNEKLVVIVLADRSKQSTPPSPNSTGIAPSSPPTNEGPSQPPKAAADINPTPSPIAEEPPANAASTPIISFLGVTGAIATSALLL